MENQTRYTHTKPNQTGSWEIEKTTKKNVVKAFWGCCATRGNKWKIHRDKKTFLLSLDRVLFNLVNIYVSFSFFVFFFVKTKQKKKKKKTSGLEFVIYIWRDLELAPPLPIQVRFTLNHHPAHRFQRIRRRELGKEINKKRIICMFTPSLRDALSSSCP